MLLLLNELAKRPKTGSCFNNSHWTDDRHLLITTITSRSDPRLSRISYAISVHDAIQPFRPSSGDLFWALSCREFLKSCRSYRLITSHRAVRRGKAMPKMQSRLCGLLIQGPTEARIRRCYSEVRREFPSLSRYRHPMSLWPRPLAPGQTTYIFPFTDEDLKDTPTSYFSITQLSRLASSSCTRGCLMGRHGKVLRWTK